MRILLFVIAVGPTGFLSPAYASQEAKDYRLAYRALQVLTETGRCMTLKQIGKKTGIETSKTKTRNSLVRGLAEFEKHGSISVNRNRDIAKQLYGAALHVNCS